MFKDLKELLADAWAFVTDPEARQLSLHKYPSGAGMSVRAAKRSGLM